MDRMSTRSRDVYHRLVYDDQSLFELFRMATPIDELANARFGSRPAYRPGAKAGIEAARLLDLKAGDAVILLRRVLEYAGTPTIFDEITLPAALFRGLTKAKYDAYHGSMYGFFETQFGVRMLKAQEKLRAVAADATAAAMLRVAIGTPLLAGIASRAGARGGRL